MDKFGSRVFILLMTMTLVVIGSRAFALSTAFTYQGQLHQDDAPADGLYDLRFSLFDADAGGTQVGTTLCADNVTVAAGVFTQQLDFGQQFATDLDLYLEIEVRQDTGLNCGNATGFTVLSPRQQLTAAPLADHAKSAFALDAADGSPANAVYVDDAGNVGIGTTAPQTTLHIDGAEEGIRIDGPSVGIDNLAWIGFDDATGTRIGYVGDGSSFDNGIVLSCDAGDVTLATPAGRVLNATSGGNVGIGTTAPTVKLDVRGDIKLGGSGEYYAPGSEENVRIIRGRFNGLGTISSGTGFSVNHVGTGQYRVIFASSFPALPVVTATPELDGGTDPHVNISFTSTTQVWFTVREGSNYVDKPMDFIAIGLR